MAGGDGVTADATPASTRRLARALDWVRDHPIAAVFAAALVLRVLVAIVLSVAGLIPRASPDAAFYVDLAERMAGGRGGLNNPISKAYANNFATYMVPVSFLFRVFGPFTFLAQLVAAAFGATSAAITTRLARELVPIGWAVAAGAIVALFPSQVLWSSLPLRDAASWATIAGLALSVTLLARAGSARQLVMCALSVAVLLVLLAHLRAYSLSVAAIALVVVAVVVPARHRIAAGLLLASMGLFLPLAMGRGVAGFDLLHYDLGKVRAGNAAGAESAFVSRERLGRSDLGHLPDGLRVVVAEPLPWTTLRGESVQLAQIESPLWWALVLASFSAVPLLWRARRVLAVPALYCAGVVLVLALAEGNFGTLYRHRGELIWPMTLLAIVGIHGVHARRSHARRRTPA